MAHSTSRTALDNVLGECWDKVAKGNAGNYIIITQLEEIVQELQRKLKQFKPLLNKEEVYTLLHMSQNKPTLRIYRAEFEKFLLKLVRATSIEAFLIERLNINEDELQKLVSGEGDLKMKESAFYKPISPPKSPILSILGRRPRTVETRSYEPLEQDNMLPGNLESNLATHKELPKPNRTIPSSTSYYSPLVPESDLKDSNETNKEIIKKIMEEMNKQTQLANKIKTKLEIDSYDKSQKLQTFIQKLPFVKQYYSFKSSNNSWRETLVDIIALILSAIIMLHIIKMGFYFCIFLVQRNRSIYSSQYYITDDNEWDSEMIRFEWWKEIAPLEYLVYQLSDWWLQ